MFKWLKNIFMKPKGSKGPHKRFYMTFYHYRNNLEFQQELQKALEGVQGVPDTFNLKDMFAFGSLKSEMPWKLSGPSVDHMSVPRRSTRKKFEPFILVNFKCSRWIRCRKRCTNYLEKHCKTLVEKHCKSLFDQMFESFKDRMEAEIKATIARELEKESRTKINIMRCIIKNIWIKHFKRPGWAMKCCLCTVISCRNDQDLQRNRLMESNKKSEIERNGSLFSAKSWKIRSSLKSAYTTPGQIKFCIEVQSNVENLEMDTFTAWEQT